MSAYNQVLGNFRPMTAQAIEAWLRAPNGPISPPAGARPQQVLRAIQFTTAELGAATTVTKTLKELNGGYPCVVTGWWASARESGGTAVDIRLLTCSIVVTTGTREVDPMPGNLVFGTSAQNDQMHSFSATDCPGILAFWSGQETRNLVVTNNHSASVQFDVCFQMLTMGV